VTKKVGLKIRAKTNGSIKTASPAKISRKIKLYFDIACCLIMVDYYKMNNLLKLQFKISFNSNLGYNVQI
jgi:hypothetical protein